MLQRFVGRKTSKNTAKCWANFVHWAYFVHRYAHYWPTCPSIDAILKKFKNKRRSCQGRMKMAMRTAYISWTSRNILLQSHVNRAVAHIANTLSGEGNTWKHHLWDQKTDTYWNPKCEIDILARFASIGWDWGRMRSSSVANPSFGVLKIRKVLTCLNLQWNATRFLPRCHRTRRLVLNLHWTAGQTLPLPQWQANSLLETTTLAHPSSTGRGQGDSPSPPL